MTSGSRVLYTGASCAVSDMTGVIVQLYRDGRALVRWSIDTVGIVPLRDLRGI